jgi:hypothetical protein
LIATKNTKTHEKEITGLNIFVDFCVFCGYQFPAIRPEEVPTQQPRDGHHPVAEIPRQLIATKNTKIHKKEITELNIFVDFCVFCGYQFPVIRTDLLSR